MVRSRVDPSASLSEFRHASGEETSQLWGSLHGGRGGRISTALIAIAPCPITGHRWSETPGGFRQARYRRSTSERRRARPAGHFPNNGGGSIVGNGFL